MQLTAILPLVAAAFLSSRVAFGTESNRSAVPRAPVPEPLITETVTDIDGEDAGEVELELNGSELRAFKGGAYVLQSSIEGEWLATRHFGVRLEPLFTRSLDGGKTRADDTLGSTAAVSWKLLQDFEHDVYLQGEASARLPFDRTAITDPGESALPAAFDFRSAVRTGRWTFRGSLGAAAGGASQHLPLRGSLAILTGFGSSERYGFWGVEADIDGTRRDSTVLALNLMPHLGPVGLPFRFGVAVPWVVGAPGDRPSTGILFRILVESAREYEYGRRRP